MFYKRYAKLIMENKDNEEYLLKLDKKITNNFLLSYTEKKILRSAINILYLDLIEKKMTNNFLYQIGKALRQISKELLEEERGV